MHGQFGNGFEFGRNHLNFLTLDDIHMEKGFRTWNSLLIRLTASLCYIQNGRIFARMAWSFAGVLPLKISISSRYQVYSSA